VSFSAQGVAGLQSLARELFEGTRALSLLEQGFLLRLLEPSATSRTFPTGSATVTSKPPREERVLPANDRHLPNLYVVFPLTREEFPLHMGTLSTTSPIVLASKHPPPYPILSFGGTVSLELLITFFRVFTSSSARLDLSKTLMMSSGFDPPINVLREPRCLPFFDNPRV